MGPRADDTHTAQIDGVVEVNDARQIEIDHAMVGDNEDVYVDIQSLDPVEKRPELTVEAFDRSL